MFIRSEEIAGTEADDFISIRHYVACIPEDVHHLSVHSDSYYGQNKNFSLVSFFMYLVGTGRFDMIEHKYLVSRKVYLPCDHDLDLEMEKIQKSFIYIPD